MFKRAIWYIVNSIIVVAVAGTIAGVTTEIIKMKALTSEPPPSIAKTETPPSPSAPALGPSPVTATTPPVIPQVPSKPPIHILPGEYVGFISRQSGANSEDQPSDRIWRVSVKSDRSISRLYIYRYSGSLFGWLFGDNSDAHENEPAVTMLYELAVTGGWQPDNTFIGRTQPQPAANYTPDDFRLTPTSTTSLSLKWDDAVKKVHGAGRLRKCATVGTADGILTCAQ